MSAASAAIAEVEDTENLFRQNASQLIARLIGEFPLINVVSPTYLERYGAPKSPSDLSTHHAVNYASPTSGRIEDWEWTEDGKVRSLPMCGRVTVNSAEAYVTCCLVGLGLIQVPAYDVRRHLDAGELVEMMAEHQAQPMLVTLLYPPIGSTFRSACTCSPNGLRDCYNSSDLPRALRTLPTGSSLRNQRLACHFESDVESSQKAGIIPTRWSPAAWTSHRRRRG